MGMQNLILPFSFGSEMGLLDLGLQEVLELTRKSHVMLWVHFGVEGKGLWFSLVLRGTKNSLRKMKKPYFNKKIQNLFEKVYISLQQDTGLLSGIPSGRNGCVTQAASEAGHQMSSGVWPIVFCPDSLWTDVLNFRGGVGHPYISWILLAAFTSLWAPWAPGHWF